MLRTVLALSALFVAVVIGAVSQANGETSGSVTFGSQWWDQTAKEAKFQEFSEEPRGVFLEEYAVRAWRDRNLLLFYGDHALRHDQSNALTWWNGARWRLDLGYQEVPHNLSFIARSPFSEIAPGLEVISDSLQAANQANAAGYPARLRDALNSSPRLNLGFRTDISRARMRARPARGWQFELNGSRRMRSGRKAFGGAFSPGNGIEIWEPIEQRILDGTARASYTKEKATLQATAEVSEFHNDVNTLTFDNPAKLTGAQNQGRIDLYPTNRSVRGTLAVGYKLPARSAFNGTVGLARNTQNDPWIPFTVNKADPYSSLDSLPSERSTHAKVDVLTQDYRLTSRPRSDVSATLKFRQYHYDNKTPEHVFSGESVADGAFTPGAIESESRSYKHNSYGGELSYTPFRKVSLTGIAERLDRTRTHREVLSDREEAVEGKLHLRPMDKLSVEGHVRHAKRWDRDADFSYDGEEQTALRRFDVGARDHMDSGGGFTLTPTERIELGGTFGYVFEKYSDDLADTVRIGLRRVHSRNASADFTFHAKDNLDLDGAFGWEQMVSRQASRQSRAAAFGTADSTWTARLKDEGWFANLGVDWRMRPDRLGFKADLDYARWPTTFAFVSVKPAVITAQNPPGIRYRRIDLTLESDYNVAERTQLGLRYNWEEFDVTDFSSVDIPNLGIAAGASNINYVYLGDSYQSYRAHRVALLVRQNF